MTLTPDQALRGTPTNALAVDTSILLLLIVGQAGFERLDREKRTSGLKVTEAEWDLIVEVVSRFQIVKTTPTVLAECSALLGQTRAKAEYLGGLANALEDWLEVYEPSANVIRSFTREYLRFGLTDVALLDLAVQGAVILTADGELHNCACSFGRSLNFIHMRDLS